MSARHTGAVPVESLQLGPAHTLERRLWRVSWGAASGVCGLAWLIGGPRDGLGVASSLVLLGGLLWLELAAGFLPGSAPAMALTDGRRVGARAFPGWALVSLLPESALALFLMSFVHLELVLVSVSHAPPAHRLQMGVSLGLGLLPVLLVVALPYLVPLASRVQRMRLVARLHFEPLEQLWRVEVAARWLWRTPRVRLCVALAALWSGEPERAERELQPLDDPVARSLLGWFRAARGELPVPELLVSPPSALGERYRWSVTLCLSALHAGCPELVHPHLDTLDAVASELPNRFGALLAHLVSRIRGERAPVDPDLAWIVTVWPFAA